MKRWILALLALMLLMPAAGLADDVPDRPAFLDGYTDYFDYNEYEGWYLACLDTSPDNKGDAVINENTHWVLLDGEGNVLYEDLHFIGFGAPFRGWGEGSPLAPLRIDGKWGYIDRTGALVVEPRFEDVGDFSEGLAAVQDVQSHLWGYVDATGALVVEPRFEYVGDFSEGLAVVQDAQSQLWGYVDATGALAIEPRFEDAEDFSEGLAAVQDAQSHLWGYVDQTGALAIAPQYDYAGTFIRQGYAEASIEGEVTGVIDRTGAWLLKLDWDTGSVALSEDDGVATAEVYDKKKKEYVTKFYDLSSGEAKEATILSTGMNLEDYMPFTGRKVAKLDGAPTLARQVSFEHDLPHLDGATGWFPVYAAYVEALYPDETRYEAWDGQNNPLVTCSKTDVAYERLIDGQADIIFVLDPSDEELQMAEAAGVAFDMLPIGREAFVFIVNRQNPLEGLTLNEIRWIYAGLIRDWSEVGVDGLGEIIPYQRPKNSGSQTALEALMDGMPLMEAPQEIVAWDMGDILETVEYRNLPNALGYSFRFFCTGMMQSDVKLLSVDGVAPTVANIRNGSYPITSTLYAIRLTTNTENPNVNALWDWLQTYQAAELMEKSGYVAN